MAIVISGGSGTIGSQLVNFFSKKFKVISIYNREVTTRVSGVKYVKYKDINKKTFANNDISMFIHCATKHYNYKGNLLFYNVSVFENILKSIVKQKLKIINLSSISVFDGTKDIKITNNTKTISKSNYGRSKILIEKMISRYQEKYLLKALSIRLPIVLGAEVNKLTFLGKLINDLKQNKKIILYNKNRLFNHVILIDQLSKFVLNKHSNLKKGHEFINLGSLRPIKISSVAKLFLQKFKYKKEVLWKKNNKKNFIIDTSKLKKNKFAGLNTNLIIKKFLKSYCS